MFKVLIADKLSDEAVKIFKDNGIETVVKTGLGEEDLIKELETCDGLVVRSATKPNKNIIEIVTGIKNSVKSNQVQAFQIESLNLNSKQKLAVESSRKITLVNAGPGTGKTFLIIARVLNELNQNNDKKT